MRILITGISGFLGSHLAKTFHDRGDQVIGIVRSASRVTHLQAAGVHLLTAALDDEAGLVRAMSGADVVLHAAARVHTHGFWHEFAGINVEGTRHVLQAAMAARVPRFIQISTVGVYGFPRTGAVPFEESHPYGSIHRWNYYSRSKMEAEKLVRAADASGRISATIVRPTWVYGSGDDSTLGRLIPALRARRIKWFGDGLNRLSIVHVSDVAKAIVLVAGSPRAAGQIYNVAADDLSPTQREYFSRISELMDLPLPQGTIPYGAAYGLGFASECVAHLTAYRVQPPLTRLTVLLLGGRRRFSSEKIHSELGWQPSVAFADGIRQAIAWYRSQRSPETASVA